MKLDFDYVSLGKRIRNRRKEKGLTQEQLAELCDLSTAHIGHIERGTRALSIESLMVISIILDISTDYLLMNVTTTVDNDISQIMKAIKNTDKEKYKKLYSVVKVLAENINNL